MFDSSVLGGSVCIALSVVLLFVIAGLGNVEITEYGLNYSRISRKVDPVAFGPGRYWISPFNYFVRFPATVKTIQYSDASLQKDLPSDERSELLRSRTSDGLDVKIELSFQYQLTKPELFSLYTTFGEDYHRTFDRIAIDRLTETATTFTANQFFVDRTTVGKHMETQLSEDFNGRLHATIFSFQLRSVELPQEFEEAIQRTEVMKQDIRAASAEQNSTIISLETDLMMAQRRTKVAQAKGEGVAKSIMLTNLADIAQFNATQRLSAESYSQVMKSLDSNEKDLMAYMKASILRDHPSKSTVLGLRTEVAPQPSD